MRIDDDIANNETLLSLFKNIHPNVISIFGIICNLIILNYLYRKEIYKANIFIIIRYFCDILDGAVARKYNKTSKLGGYLDTFNDIMFMSTYSSFIFWLKSNNLKDTKLFFYIITLFLVLYFKYEDVMYDHTKLKKIDKNSFKNVIAFLTNNSIFLFLLVIYYNSFLL